MLNDVALGKLEEDLIKETNACKVKEKTAKHPGLN